MDAGGEFGRLAVSENGGGVGARWGRWCVKRSCKRKKASCSDSNLALSPNQVDHQSCIMIDA